MFISDLYFDGSEQMSILTHFQTETESLSKLASIPYCITHGE